MIWVGAAVLGFICLVCYLLIEHGKDLDLLRAKFRSLEGFTPSQEFITSKIALAVDEGRNLLCFVWPAIDGVDAQVFAAFEILESAVEVVSDGATESVTRTSRTSQLGGALVGNAVFGPLGAVVGGLSGKKHTKTKDTALKIYRLHITVNDVKRPVRTVTFPGPGPANHWHAIVSILVRNADQVSLAAKPELTQLPPPRSSVADEIVKLGELMNQGLLSREEFEREKLRLLQ
jgi:hypothetical protein